MKAGDVTRDTLVWTQGMTGWAKAGELGSLAAAKLVTAYGARMATQQLQGQDGQEAKRPGHGVSGQKGAAVTLELPGAFTP